MELHSECVFVLFPNVADRNEFALDYSLNWLLFVYIHLWTDMLLACAASLPGTAYPCDYTLYEVSLLTPRVKIMLWLKLAIAWDISPLCFFHPFSKVALPLKLWETLLTYHPSSETCMCDFCYFRRSSVRYFSGTRIVKMGSSKWRAERIHFWSLICSCRDMSISPLPQSVGVGLGVSPPELSEW